MQNTDKKSFSFWKETFIQCTALEAFLLEVMRTNIKNKEKQKKKWRQMFVQLLRNVSLSTNYSHGKHRKNLCGVPETEEQISRASKPRQFQNKANQGWADSNPDKTFDPPLFLCMTIPQKGLTNAKAFCQGMKWNRADHAWASALSAQHSRDSWTQQQ